MSKEMWFAEFEAAYNEALDEMPEKAAYDKAAERAEIRYRDRLADIADHARLLKKEGKL